MSAIPANDTNNDNNLKVMVVDDSAIIRGLISRWLEEDGGITVTSTASNGAMALRNLERADPDVVILDVEMPEMDGMTALPRIMEAAPHVKVIMASTLTRRNAEISIQALKAGAADYIPKPESTREANASELFRHELKEKVRALGAVSRREAGKSGSQKVRTLPVRPLVVAGKDAANQGITLRKPSKERPRVLVVGSSTGGPQALFRFLAGLGQKPDVPVLITQHMPATFTTILANQLARSLGIPCKEAEAGEPLQAGHFYIAPGGRHMVIADTTDGPTIRLNDDPPENYCRPAVDQLFRSAAAVFGGATLGVVLTGMGHDGLAGGRVIVEQGGTIIAQDEETSIVWGMPGAVSNAGLASAVLPLDKMSDATRKLIKGDRL